MKATRPTKKSQPTKPDQSAKPTSLNFTANAVIDIDAASAGEDEMTLPRFKMLAYTGSTMRVSGWRHPVIIDLAGLSIPSQSRPIRFGHDPLSGVGHTDAIRIEQGQLMASGVVSRDTPAAREVVISSKNGFPWQASIGASVEEFEFVKDRQTVTVNGRQYDGPLNVVRKASLGEISFVDLGADGATNCRAMFCHTRWYSDLIRQHRGPANQSEIILWPYPIDPWPGEPLPDAYDLLIYAKNGHRPQLLEHLAEVFPRHVQIHYGQYRREELFEAARRSRACAYLADDDHGPLALQEILLAGCPTVGVRTGASFVRTVETGVIVERLPPGAACIECEQDADALAVFIDSVQHAQTMDRRLVRQFAAEQFGTTRITDQMISGVRIAT